MNLIKKYWDSVYIYVLLLIPGCCMCAGLFWSACKILGYYPDLSWGKIAFFDFTQLIYLVIAIFFIFLNKKYPDYILSHLFYVKCYISIALFIQYNFIMILFPSTYVWGCTFLFLAVPVLFFDLKMMVADSILYLFSLLTAHLLNPEEFLPLDAPNIKEQIAFRIVILSLTLALVCIIIFFVEHFLIQARITDEENVHLLEKQVAYYQNAELFDQELRKFRHDIKNHFLCMDYLIKQDKTEELTEYFNDLMQSFDCTEKLYFSGSHIIDAILNYDLNRSCSKKVQTTVTGSLLPVETVSSIDLCTLFSNVLSNAIEAANCCSEYHNSELSVHFQSGTKYFCITVINSVCDHHPKKPDRNHGFGLIKIREIVEKYHGTFEQTYSDQQVITKIYLPI